MTLAETRKAADAMIGAAQELERCARELKAQAKTLRTNRPMDIDRKLWTMHKRHDVRAAADRALTEIGDE